MSGPAADPTDEKLTTMGPDSGHPFLLQLEAMARVRAIAAAPGSPAGLSPGEVYAQHKETLRREVRRQLLDLAHAGDSQLTVALVRILPDRSEAALRDLIVRLYGSGLPDRHLSDEDQRRRYALAMLTFDSDFQLELQLALREARTTRPRENPR
jgi:hypothetical protein